LTLWFGFVLTRFMRYKVQHYSSQVRDDFYAPPCTQSTKIRRLRGGHMALTHLSKPWAIISHCLWH